DGRFGLGHGPLAAGAAERGAQAGQGERGQAGQALAAADAARRERSEPRSASRLTAPSRRTVVPNRPVSGGCLDLSARAPPAANPPDRFRAGRRVPAIARRRAAPLPPVWAHARSSAERSGGSSRARPAW